jgi:putative ABC transport system ATP-binding protein
VNLPVTRGCLAGARTTDKSFGRAPVLRGASLAVGQGEFLAVMGPSGSGESALLGCLAGIFRPDSGEVRSAAPAAAGRERPRSGITVIHNRV